MAGKFDRANHPRGYARIALATIRLFNGTAALFAPTTLARRLGDNPEANPAALYGLRLFGVRTILIGAQLLLRNGELCAHALRVAPMVHPLDAIAVVSAAARGNYLGVRPQQLRLSRRSTLSWPSSRTGIRTG